MLQLHPLHRRATTAQPPQPPSLTTTMAAISFPCNLQPLLSLSHSKTLMQTRQVNVFSVTNVSRSDANAVSTKTTGGVVAAPPQPLLQFSPNSLQYEEGEVVGVSYGGGVSESSIGAMEYLTNILMSKVYDVAVESPLQHAAKLSARLGVDLWLKREDTQPIFSFKLRGAYNMMAKLSKKQLTQGVICSSAGNHALGVTMAAKTLGCDAVIVMPITTPRFKWESVKSLGATVVLEGDSYDEAQAYAKNRGVRENRTFIPSSDHPDVISGQGTIGMEIMRQSKGQIHAIFVPVGGGGLIAGIAAYVKRVSPEVRIIGVEPADANAMALSLHHGQRVKLDQVGGFVDGVAVNEVGVETFSLCKELIDGVVLVSRDAICASIKDVFEENRSILEPAGALAVAGAEAYCRFYNLKDANVVAITSGANMEFNRLRLVTELANIGRRQEAVLATFMPEEPGSIKQFCSLIGPISITEFNYRYDSNKNRALVLYSIGVHTKTELQAMIESMKSFQLETIEFTDNDMVKDHLRHLMGGRSDVANELLCRFIFPERPGALAKFLDVISPRWNITLFHYRSQGESGANVLIGIQVSSAELNDFRSCANDLGFDYEIETDNEGFQLLMR
ncbi:putative threonine ammonia-lyase [Helianthus annuus]|nr:threonine dehydratase 1 biosynthetic, chloroplastic [Helianthus annuus]XP_021985863.1 threonine dehydratase 1 biosynthetic, chloroplastic [Helianthus annuus]XP_021985869.1 threonine dehydratase 1 biosynthetic, chloroplastic [Helianthus annuus]XP_021985873.1 threonine dehydratase 1 biosynthetic, chloroplastic [Helianthus annuus]KAF5823705.1 putative threonine ammonia-lyase [Helianthus annuus]KAJ0949754.1 putative threonine ammonia-lyase [Helianthus annuus]KAJ0958531.1 putative threonine amm